VEKDKIMTQPLRPIDQYNEAFIVWNIYHQSDELHVRQISFISFISGPPSIREHRINLLLGPHAKTVIKAYYARMEE
jgi:hypothetical protein